MSIQHATAPERSVHVRWTPWLIVAAVLAAYAGSWRGPFVLDDITSIHDNPTIRTLWPPWAALSPPAGQGLTPNGRPLVNLSLAINHAISGERTWSYHAFNLAVHVGAALALLGVLRRLFRKLDLPEGAAVAAALIWAVHPLLTESVTYVVQRAESMMGLCYLLTLSAFTRRRWAMSVAACAAGMACKEVMVSAPLIVLLYDRTFESGTFREAWRQRRGYYVALAATWAVLGYEVIITGNRGGTAGFGGMVHVAWWRYAITQLPAVVHYVRLCFWPHRLIFDYGMGLATQPWRTIPAAVAIAALLGGTCAHFSAPSLHQRALSFAGVTFFAILAPTSSILPIATQTMAEHRMYLPAAVVVATAVGLCCTFISRAVATISVGILVCGLAALTSLRNRDYRSNLILWTVTARDYPRSTRALYNLGVAQTGAGQLEAAVHNYEAALAIQPDYTDAHENLANTLVKLGRPEASLVHYEVAAQAHPASSDLQCSLGIALLATSRVEPAISHFRSALQLNPGNQEATYQLGEAFLRDHRPAEALPLLRSAQRAHVHGAALQNALGNAYSQLDRSADAIDAYNRALDLDPKFAEAHNNLGSLLLQSGRAPFAIPEFQAALRSDPKLAAAHANLGSAYLATGEVPAALAEFATAVRLEPDSADSRYDYANTLTRSGQLPAAMAQYRAVLRLRPSFAEAHNNLGIVLAQSDQLPAALIEFQAAIRLKSNYQEAKDNLSRARTALGSP